jgi:hypothetical protein
MLFKTNYSAYKPEKLPSNRKEQFWDILKHNILLLLLLGFIFLLFSLPLLISAFVRDYYFSLYSSAYANEEITAEQLTSLTKSLLMTMNIVISCSYVLLAIPLAGTTKIARRLIWSEQAFFGDFWTGIKENGLKMLALTLVISASIYGLYSLQMASNINWFLKYGPYGIFAIVLLPFSLHFIALINIYNQPIGQTIRNSFIIYFKTPFVTILFAVAPLLAFYLVNLIDFVAIRMLIHALSLVVLLPIYLLLWFVYDISILDKSINKTLFPEAYKKGLYIKKSEEDANEESR